jgi:hypothetical protein
VYNRPVYAPLPSVAPGFRLALVSLRAPTSLANIPTPPSTHIFAVAGTLRVPLSQPPKHRQTIGLQQPERYVKCP